MKNLTCTIIIDILLLIGVVYLFTMCSSGNKNTYNVNTTNSNYNINHYIDTINGNVILTTVCKRINGNELSISTLKLK